MPKPFDATLKDLLEKSPSDWAALAGCPYAPVDVIDVDISTVSGATDKVLRVRGAPDLVVHFDFQAGPDSALPRRLHLYNTLLEERLNLRVRSVAVLLRPQADLANLTGVHERDFPGEGSYLTFRYRVIRVWQLPVEPLLLGGPGMLPLAPISAVTETELQGVVDRMRQRMAGQPRGESGKLWTAALILMGLRYEQALVDQLLQGVMGMEESVTYQAIIAKGERQGALREARKTLLLLGRKQFGVPPAEATAEIAATNDLERLEQLSVRLLDVASWQELLDLPRPRSRRRKCEQGDK